MSYSSEPALPTSIVRHASPKPDNICHSEPVTPVLCIDRSVNASPLSMEEIQRPLPAAVLRMRAENSMGGRSQSQSSIVTTGTTGSTPSVLPCYSEPEAALINARQNELNNLRDRYQQHREQYHIRRRTYMIILFVLALGAGAFVLLAFMISSPHIIMALGVVLIVIFVCIAHRITMHREVLRRERQVIESTEQLHRFETGDRDFPLPDDQYLVITQNSRGQERRTLISAPPNYENATTVPPAYNSKNVGPSEEPREMEEIRIA
ncbi:hypothetical protein INT43_004621 [Umbelopsis isabellina]|uniref:Uncharacterized protein n=1 Tax=Mortierella isabellina TaxID=91625 RepID=A0A8H7PFY7_MORIS|nr:hypothetical protein INT43_004621 [Umbelopsis isabellina]